MVNSMSLSLLAATSFPFAMPSTCKGTPSTGVVHQISAGFNNNLRFEPENVVAEIGDLIEFRFLPKNHSVVQSSFDKPCEPLSDGGGVFSGFNFPTSQGEAPDVFVFTVKSKEPFWYYCSQTVGNHCQGGMSGVINQNTNSDETLANYKKNAVNAITNQPSTDILASHGGWKVPRKPS
ncbi:Cupredoxin [Phaeosphaeriaceae sp. PMI808]|nr:Cupredoxin [Phaeosphaeriaceae sp. PMI808]